MKIDFNPKILFKSSSPFERVGFKMPTFSTLNFALQQQELKTDIFKERAVTGVEKNLKPFIIGAIIAAGVSALALYLFEQKRRPDFTYIKKLARDMSKEIGKTVKQKQLDCIMGKEELLSALPKFNNKIGADGKLIDNYLGYVEMIDKGKHIKTRHPNFDNGVFKIDLHSHSNYSDGRGKVKEILEEAAKYANDLRLQTGEKFVFALTDHDGVEGVKEALKLIAEKPEKYKNLRFVPGVELSYIHKCEKGTPKFISSNNPLEGSELLVHCINPYSKNLSGFIDNLRANRIKMFDNILTDLSSNIGGTKFLKEELLNGAYMHPEETFAVNLHWRVYHYAQVKNKITELAKEQGQDPQELYAQLVGSWQCDRNYRTLDAFNKFIGARGYNTIKPANTNTIEEICRKHFPKIEDGKITALSESTFEELIDMLSKEKEAVAGFAHPGFSAICYKDPAREFQGYVTRSKGVIKTAEKYHQAYHIPKQNEEITQKQIDDVNAIMDKLGLLFVGGHDNHGERLFR